MEWALFASCWFILQPTASFPGGPILNPGHGSPPPRHASPPSRGWWCGGVTGGGRRRRRRTYDKPRTGHTEEEDILRDEHRVARFLAFRSASASGAGGHGLKGFQFCRSPLSLNLLHPPAGKPSLSPHARRNRCFFIFFQPIGAGAGAGWVQVR